MGQIPRYENSIQVLDRAVRILEAVSRTDGATLSSIAEQVSLPLSTVSRILDTLGYHSLIERDERSRTYRLGRRFLTLSAAVPQQASDLVLLARGILERLATTSGEDVGLSRLHGTHAIIIDRVDGPHPLKIIDVLERPQPLHCGAFRKVLLAHQTAEWIESYLSDLKLVKYTPNTLRSKSAIRAELDLIRSQGYATSQGEILADAAGVAAPVFGIRGKLEAALFLVLPTSRLTPQQTPELAQLLITAARELSARIRGEQPRAQLPVSGPVASQEAQAKCRMQRASGRAISKPHKLA